MTDKSRNTDPKSGPVGNPAGSNENTVSPSGSGSRPANRNQSGTSRPVDSADRVDLGEDSGIPTYTGPSDTQGRSNRATPQNISPETTAFEGPGNNRLASDAPTTVAPRPFTQEVPPPAQPTRQLDREPAQGNHGDYGDTDFAASAVATPVAVPPEEHVSADHPAVLEDARRGTLDFGLLIIRAAIGIYLIIRGVFTFFTLGGSQGLAGLESEFADYQWPEILAILLPSLELAAGVFLLLGLMTPVAAAVATVATSFTALHQINVHEGGWGELGEPIVLAIILTLVVIGLQFTGPGRISLDAGRSWARRPLVSSWIFVIIGIALAVVLWWFGAGVNPIGSGSLV